MIYLGILITFFLLRGLPHFVPLYKYEKGVTEGGRTRADTKESGGWRGGMGNAEVLQE